jgi:hypothetical protein
MVRAYIERNKLFYEMVIIFPMMGLQDKKTGYLANDDDDNE